MYASTYTIDEKWFAVFLRLHTSAFDRASAMTLMKELLRLVARRDGDDDGGEETSGDKVNIVVALHKEMFVSINKFFLALICFLTKKMEHTIVT
jgi:hypothetical protein